MNLSKLPQYRLIQKERIEDIQSDGYVLEHCRTHARIMVLLNEDENKVFNIAFRTPPTDSTGVAHIIEHSVLCGSRLFPAKDPFVELVKGSLNTFLNAMTYPDKTMYPLASCNDADFKNLMHVYLDAVFYPNIYQKEEIFLQEGWHYELESAEDELQYNGVVYNEMKGVFSSPEDVLEREIMNALFPDTTYGVESGGDPDAIPTLKYEDFLAFHKKYYHPSNSYIYFYGKMDIEERLHWLDQEYLSKFDALEVDSAIALQTPFEACAVTHLEYPVSESDPLEQNTYLAYNAVIGTSLDVELSNAFAVLDYALLSSPGAVLKQALLDAGIGKDIMSDYDSGIRQPMLSIIAKNATVSDQERFVKIITDTLEDIVRTGIDKKALLAGINSMEFKFREADYGTFPKGLIYGIDVFDSWLYDDQAAFDYLKQLDVYASLRQKVESDYFEQLLRRYLLENTHAAVLVAEPKRGLTAKRDQETAEKLRAYKASLSQAEIEKLVEKTKKLREFQEAPSTPEELEKIPMLAREEIGKKAAAFSNHELEMGGIPVIHHDFATNGIAYMNLLFDIQRVSLEDLPYLGLLKAVLGMVRTDQSSYQELNNEINSNTGGIAAGISVFPVLPDGDQIRVFAGIKASALYDKIPYAVEKMQEIILQSRFDEDKRLYEIVSKLKSRLSMQLSSAGHSSAAVRSMSYFSQICAFNDQISGIAFYRFIEKLEADFENRREALCEKLSDLCRVLFTREGCIVSITSDAKGLERLKAPLEQLAAALPHRMGEPKENRIPLEQKNEGFTTPGQVQYVARSGNFVKQGYSYTGLLRILKVMMSYDYLWQNVRVKGGAYGCMSSFGRTGDTYFVSYRDPNLKKTNDVFDGIPEYLKQFEANEREMTKYIIGTVSELDTPLTPADKGKRSLNAYFSKIKVQDLQAERDEILLADAGKIRALAPLVKSVLSEGNLCVIGNEEKIKQERALFGTIEQLS